MEDSTNSKNAMISVKLEKDLRRLSNRNTGRDMEKALQYVRNGISIREAAKLTNLAYATVRRYWLKSIDVNNLKNKISSNATNPKHTYVFNEQQEYQLLTKYFVGVPDLQCRKLAYRIAMLNRITVDPKWHDNQMASEEWLTDFKLRHSKNNNCDNDSIIKNLTPSPLNKQIGPGKSDIRNIRRSLPLLTPISNQTQDEEEIVAHNSEMDIPEYYEEFNDSDFESTSDEGDGIPIQNSNNPSTCCNTIVHTIIKDNSELEDIKPNLKAIDKSPDKEKEKPTEESVIEDKTLKNDSLFQSELINALKLIANSTSQKDPDELFLLSLLPALKKVKETEKLKARIELIKALEKFN